MGAIREDELVGWEKAQDERCGIRGGGGGDSSMDGECGYRGRGGGGGDGGKERIQVSVRLRPLNAKELARVEPSDWECINDTTIFFRNSLPDRSMFPTAYTFDRVFQCGSTTKQVYEEGAKEVALSVVGGINASIFAYGQTSSGKTYTMTGITEYAVTDIYEYIQRHEERAYILKFSAIEIYNEAVKDLLRAENISLRLLDDPDRGTIVEKLTEETLRDLGHMKELLSICEAQRQMGETSLNETSSRSHQILRLTIESSACEFLGKDHSSSLSACVNFVDLAGSERASQALSGGTRLKEGCHINRSLLTLGTVIRKLSKGRNGHIPYRDSKLTRILQPSLGGNSRTAIICTLSPARSHIEQSRNTLLFASCAKEVATSAQVNIVMSDKALVRHLQRELARLESELRCPAPISSKSYAEALLKEKDGQIQKMEKEIKELIQQRDLAQSRLEDFLRAVGDDKKSRQWDGFVDVPDTCEEELSIYDSSCVLDSFVKYVASQDFANDSANCNESYLERLKNKHDTTSPQNSISGANSIGLASQQGVTVIAKDYCSDMEDLCKEVRCIEMDETTSRVEWSDDVSTEGSDNHENQESVTKSTGDKDTSERKAIAHFVKKYPEVPYPWPSMQDLSSCRSLGLTKSRSCKATLMNNSTSPWFLEDEQNGHTPPSSFLKDFPGRPEGFHRKIFPLRYGPENKVALEYGPHASERTSVDALKTEKKTDIGEDITIIHTFAAELEMAQVQLEKHLNDDQVVEQKSSEGIKIENPVKDVGLDTMINPMASPLWPEEFERQQQEIIESWHACNVSLVHRTYFFLLFKGDPKDSVYMEVEMRRLSFLRRVFIQGNLNEAVVENGYNITLSSSIRALRRERGMLCRQIQKRFSAEERKSLFRKWKIPLHTKQRKVQLSRRLWSETRDMDHIKESASVVAQLVGLLEPDEALKEMFGLSFTPQQINRRSQSWKRGISSLI
uniref:Kinesin-related protein 11 n=1 Tax=Anthurium amnicola TaxID=1678845 RepID=A0A1D1XEW6_9ARAE